MHPGLEIPEILESIFTHLDGRYVQSRTGLKDLAALARTCKDFQNPALDLLWREQTGLLDLLKCFPSHLWEEDKIDEGEDEDEEENDHPFRITGSISPEDWDVPLAYASRIQTLIFYQQHFESAAVLEGIRRGLPRQHLCPNLQRIKVVWLPTANPSALATVTSLFGCPRLIDVAIYVSESAPDVLSLQGLRIRYSELTVLDLAGEFGCTSASSGVLSPIVLSLNRIECLSCRHLNREAMEHISQLPGLRRLTLIAPALPHLPSPPFPSTMGSRTSMFPALRSLYLLTTTIEFVIGFLELLTNSCLAELCISYEVHTTKYTITQLYMTMERHLSHAALQNLEIVHNDDDDGATGIPLAPSEANFANYMVDGRRLAVLCCFANLTRILLRTPLGFDVDDTTAWSMARAWPRLRSLALQKSSYCHHPFSVTLVGPKAFATHCRELVYLGITFDASTVPPLGNISAQSSLTGLAVGVSTITDAPAVAEFLVALFPNLRYIEWSGGPPDGEDDEVNHPAGTRWKAVESMLQPPASDGGLEG
ncbi:hypothetical protein K438DRAFT_1976594 [Mycena galopus ATCC 62051]|nr:hypothetical protein K438DRAFT_1976594 [Mycena galopus ATCC 62051]